MTTLLVVLEATLGGTRRHVVDLLMSLDLQKYDIIFVYSRERADKAFAPALAKLKQRGIRLFEVPFCREVRPMSDALACWQLIKIVRSTKPEVIHLHGAKAGAVGRLAAILCRVRGIVYTPHGGSFHKFTGVTGTLYLAFERLLTAMSDTHFIGVSEDSCQQIRERLRVKQSRVHLAYNGIGPLAYGNVNEARASRDGHEKFIVLFPAVFLEAKGHTAFLDALHRSKTALHPRIEIWLAGDGPLRDQIDVRIRGYSLDKVVKPLGFIENMAPLYEQCDFVVLPSKDEAFGYVALEAMQHGKMILASSVGGLREIIQHDVNGRFLQEVDWDDICGVLNTYADDPALLSRLGSAGKKSIERKFSLNQMIRDTAEVYTCAEKSLI